MNSENSSTVHRLNVEEVAPRSPKPRTEIPIQTAARSSTLDVVVMAFTGLGYALSARSLLLLALIGAFVLAVMAMQSQTMASLEVLVAYSVIAILPIAYLEVRKRG